MQFSLKRLMGTVTCLAVAAAAFAALGKDSFDGPASGLLILVAVESAYVGVCLPFDKKFIVVRAVIILDLIYLAIGLVALVFPALLSL